MRRAGYLARLALQSGVVVRGTPTKGMNARTDPPPAGIEMVSERIVASAAPPNAPTASPRVSADQFMTEPRAAAMPVGLASIPATPEHRRELEEDRHPVVRVGEARRSPAVPVTDVPPQSARVTAVPMAPLAAPRAPYAIDQDVFVVADEQAPLIGARPAAPPPHAARREVEPPSSPLPAGTNAVPAPARFARALADARRWVSAPPVPDDLARIGTAAVRAEETSASAPRIAVREQVVAAAPVAPAMQELRVSIGRIEVVIDDPPAPAPVVPARAAAPVAPSNGRSNAPPAMRRLSRHYLRG
jgi:hypothetical protein